MSTYVIKLGGSILSKSEEVRIDFNYLDRLANLLKSFIDKGDKFIIVVGGGYVCREYQKLMKENKADISDLNLDYIGIASINLNAEMVRSYLSELAEERIVRYADYDEGKEINFSKGILVCAANNPGHSSDVDSVIVANKIGSKVIFRLTDVDGIYDKDPSENKDAVKFGSLTWDKYFDVIGVGDFVPGGHYPIDPIASRMSKEAGIVFKIMKGENLQDLDKAIREEDFDGTIVSN